MQRAVRAGVLAAAVLAAAGLALTACAAPRSGPSPSPSASLPASFPRAVPVAPGRIVASDASGGEWHVWVASRSPVPDYRAALRTLTARGFSVTVDNVDATSGQGQVCSPRWCVDLNAYRDPVHGESLGYEVYRNTGLDPVG